MQQNKEANTDPLLILHLLAASSPAGLQKGPPLTQPTLASPSTFPLSLHSLFELQQGEASPGLV